MLRDTPFHRLAKKLLPKRIWPRHVMARQILERTGKVVYSGPFRGMKYCDEGYGSVYFPKLLGTYEKELHETIEAMIASGPSKIVDIGAAEGYYAVGLAIRLPASPVVAFEMSAEGSELLVSMAGRNGVRNRIDLRGKCESSDLGSVLSGTGNEWVICDVEGYEQELLDPAKVPALAKTSMLVELHEFAVPGISETLMRRFSPTHTVRRIDQTDRRRSDYPFNTYYSSILPAGYATYHVQEFRPERMSWFVMEPNADGRRNS